MASGWLAVLLGLLGCSWALAEPAAPREIRLASEVWAYTQADASGLAWDILRPLFERWQQPYPFD